MRTPHLVRLPEHFPEGVIVDVIQAMKMASDAIENMKNAELNQAIADVKLAMANLTLEKVDLMKRVHELEEEKHLREKMSFDGKMYRLEGVDGHEGGPFCQRCWDSGKNMSHLIKQKSGNWYCTVCARTTHI